MMTGKSALSVASSDAWSDRSTPSPKKHFRPYATSPPPGLELIVPLPTSTSLGPGQEGASVTESSLWDQDIVAPWRSMSKNNDSTTHSWPWVEDENLPKKTSCSNKSAKSSNRSGSSTSSTLTDSAWSEYNAKQHFALYHIASMESTYTTSIDSFQLREAVKAPALVLCIDGSEAGKGNLLENCGRLSGGFRSACEFSRWLFQQPRDRDKVAPDGILVVSWREAKPCASAVSAVFTSNTSKLRRDSKRCELSPCLYPYAAIDTIFLLPPSHKPKPEVPKWATEPEMLGIRFLILPTDLTPETFKEFLSAHRQYYKSGQTSETASGFPEKLSL